MGNECPQGHQLTEFQPKRYGFSCDGCGDSALPTDSLYGCRQCNYDLCETCVIKQNNDSDEDENESIVKCKRCEQNNKDRELIYATPHELIEIDSGYMFGFACNICRKSFDDTGSYNCKYCNYDLCRDCYHKVKNGLHSDDENDDDNDDDDDDDNPFTDLIGAMIKHQMEQKMEEITLELKENAEESISTLKDELDAEREKNLNLMKCCEELKNQLNEMKTQLNTTKETVWQRKRIDKWRKKDVIYWILSMDVQNKWENKLIEEITKNNCDGKDIAALNSPDEFGDAFDIEDNSVLCNKLYKYIKRLKAKQKQKKDNEFKINIFSQDTRMTINQRVTKNVTVMYVTKLYKQQSGVATKLDDIQLFSRLKKLPKWKTLEDVGIINDRHLITVKFVTDSVAAPKCACGMLLQKMISAKCYEGGGVFCDLCMKRVESDEYVYHCTAKKTSAHSSGYDVCKKCSTNTF